MTMTEIYVRLVNHRANPNILQHPETRVVPAITFIFIIKLSDRNTVVPMKEAFF